VPIEKSSDSLLKLLLGCEDPRFNAGFAITQEKMAVYGNKHAQKIV